jgi:anti-anti-sigma factor
MQLVIDTIDLSSGNKGNNLIFKIIFSGDLNFSSYQNFADTVAEFMQKGALRFIFDFKDLDSIDSIGIGSLINIAKILEKHQGECVIIRSRDHIYSLINQLYIDKLIRNFRTLDEANDYFSASVC